MLDHRGVPKEIYNDHRFVDMGDLPTGFGPYLQHNVSAIYVRPFCVRELSLLNMGSSLGHSGIGHIIRAVDMAISCDVNMLTDGDFEYIMAWLRLNSYPKAPSLVQWTCKKVNVVEKKGRAFRTEPQLQSMSVRDLARLGLEFEVCNAQNNEIVHNVASDIETFDDSDLTMVYEDLDFPRVGTMVELYSLLKTDPEAEHHAKYARWVKAGDTLKQKMQILTEQKTFDQYNRISECMQRYAHGIKESMQLRCRTCGNKVPYVAKPNVLTFFADNSEKDILDIQYSLLAELKMQPNDDMPAKSLLYHHSCLAKDKQAEEERNRIHRATRKR